MASRLTSGAQVGGTVRQRAAREIRDRILTGELVRGDRLDIDALRREFQTSRTPVREAVLELLYEGLVSVAPRTSITVIGLTPRDTLDNFAILGQLSGMAAKFAAERMVDRRLAEIYRLAEPIPEDADVSVLNDANWNFHRAINQASESPRLLTHIGHALRVVPSNFFEVLSLQQESNHPDHFELLAALEARDGDRAHKIAEKHFRDAGEYLAEWLSAHQAEASPAVLTERSA